MTEPPYYPPPPGDYPPPGGGYQPPQGGSYGYPPPQPPGYGYGYPSPGYPQQSVGTNGMAIASLVTALVGFLICIIGSFLGVIFGIIALNQIRNTGQGGRGMAIAGIIIGGLGTALALVLFIVFVIIGANSKPDDTYSGAPAPVVAVQYHAAAAAAA